MLLKPPGAFCGGSANRNPARMQVKKIQQYLTSYQDDIQERRYTPKLFLFETLESWSDNWDIDAPDFPIMYDHSIQNSYSRRLWNSTGYTPKSTMIHLLRHDPEFGRRSFANLFNEEVSIDNRISRFKFCCDELLSSYKRAKKGAVVQGHDHEDNRMIFLYLCMTYPDKYAFFEFNDFYKAMKALGMTKLPGPYEIERFVKISKTLFSFLQKEEKLLESIAPFIPKTDLKPEINMLVLSDWYHYLSGKV